MGSQGKNFQFEGMLDRVRVYKGALSEKEIATRFKTHAAEYGFDTTWFSRLKVKPYYYLQRDEVVIEADFKGLQPLRGNGRLEATLAAKQNPSKVLVRKVVEKARANVGVEELPLPCENLSDGQYLIRVQIKDEQTTWPVEEVTFSYPAKQNPVVSPAQNIVDPLPPPRQPVPFAVQVHRGGGFTVKIKDGSYPFVSRISWPQGDFNRLAASDDTKRHDEDTWQVEIT